MTLSDNHTPYFPLDDVEIRRVPKTRTIAEPLYTNNWMSINEREFFMQVKDAGTFYARDGKSVELSPVEQASTPTIELYLNGSVFGAVLHQRQILPIHGSSFAKGSKGFIISGESGAGKSSLTTAFCLNGNDFLTDDVTPIVFKNEAPQILPFSDRIKLWGDSLAQFQKKSESLKKITPDQEKFYYPVIRNHSEKIPLRALFIVEPKKVQKPEFRQLDKTLTIPALQHQIYRYGFLAGMPHLKAVYFHQLVSIGKQIPVIQIERPLKISISEMHNLMDEYIEKELL
jgi:hypothetical protein